MKRHVITISECLKAHRMAMRDLYSGVLSGGEELQVPHVEDAEVISIEYHACSHLFNYISDEI